MRDGLHSVHTHSIAGAQLFAALGLNRTAQRTLTLRQRSDGRRTCTDSKITTTLSSTRAANANTTITSLGNETPRACGHLADDEAKCRIKSYAQQGLPVRLTQQFSITLPNEMAEAVRSKVAAGEYATESEVIRDGLRALLARDRAVESWLRVQVAPAYDALKADPSRAIGVDELRASLAAEHRKKIEKA